MKKKFDLPALFFNGGNSSSKHGHMPESPNASTQVDYSQQNESIKLPDEFPAQKMRVYVPPLKKQVDWTNNQEYLNAEIDFSMDLQAERDNSRHIDLNELIQCNECVSCDDRYIFRKGQIDCRSSKRTDRISNVICYSS